MRILIVLTLLTGSLYAQSARDYYNEIYKAGGLDRMADTYVCFDDDPALKTFFIFAKSEAMRQFLIEKGAYKKLTKKQQADLDKGFLMTRGYDKGVPHSAQETFGKDGDTWVGDPVAIQGTKIRLRMGIEWSTLRYKRSVEFLNPNGTVKTVYEAHYGRCEEIPSDVIQKGNP